MSSESLSDLTHQRAVFVSQVDGRPVSKSIDFGIGAQAPLGWKLEILGRR